MTYRADASGVKCCRRFDMIAIERDRRGPASVPGSSGPLKESLEMLVMDLWLV